MGLLTAIGILWAFYATAATPPADYYNTHVDYFTNTITKDDGFNYEAFDTYLESIRQRPNKATGLSRNIRCSCVLYIKYLTGFSTPIGAARNWPIDSHEPAPGAVIVFTSGRYGHVALVESFTATTVTIHTESNWLTCQVTGRRTISRFQWDIKGYDLQ